MQLIIANCTKQPHDFTYRVPGTGQLRRQPIPAGGNSRIHEDAPEHILREIIAQHAHYGLIDAKTIDQRRGFIGLCFSFDKPVDVQKILYADEANTGVLEATAHELGKERAAAIAGQIEDQLGEVTRVEVEVVEDSKPGDNTPGQFAQGFEVTSRGTAPRRSKK